MNDFIFHNPDKVYFGKSHLKNLPAELLNFGKKVLFVYGGGVITGLKNLDSNDVVKIYEMCL